MKVLSVRQPWAGLIFHGKDVENRTWATGYRGLVLIHAGLRLDKEAFQFFETAEGRALMGRSELPDDCGVTGGIIGAVELAGCFRYSQVHKGRSKWHMKGQYGLYLQRPQLFSSTIKCRGQLGLFDPAPDVRAQAERLLAESYA